MLYLASPGYDEDRQLVQITSPWSCWFLPAGNLAQVSFGSWRK